MVLEDPNSAHAPSFIVLLSSCQPEDLERLHRAFTPLLHVELISGSLLMSDDCLVCSTTKPLSQRYFEPRFSFTFLAYLDSLFCDQ